MSNTVEMYGAAKAWSMAIIYFKIENLKIIWHLSPVTAKRTSFSDTYINLCLYLFIIDILLFSQYAVGLKTKRHHWSQHIYLSFHWWNGMNSSNKHYPKNKQTKKLRC